MDLSCIPSGTLKPETFARNMHSFTAEEFGVRVTVSRGTIGRGDVLTVRIDPSGRDGHYRLDVQEVSASDIQVRIIAGTKSE